MFHRQIVRGFSQRDSGDSERATEQSFLSLNNRRFGERRAAVVHQDGGIP
jgi:hypothetical protein